MMMKDISEIIYTSDSGTILPELQWHEQITITQAAVTLVRGGRSAGSQINAGTWTMAPDARAVAGLFAQLQAVDPARIARVEPEDAPDGGGAESYTILYGRGKRCSLRYDPGVTYTGGAAIAAPIAAFIRGLSWPAGAAQRYDLAA